MPFGFVVGVAAAILLWVLYSRTRFGFEVQALHGDAPGSGQISVEAGAANDLDSTNGTRVNGSTVKFLVDTGATAVSLSAADAKRIGLETMDTQAACRTYNFLTAEGRKVVAALLL